MSTIEITMTVQSDGAAAIPRETLVELGYHPGDEIKVALEVPEATPTGVNEPLQQTAEDQTLADMLAGKTGVFHFGNANLSQESGRKFAEILNEKRTRRQTP